MKNSFIKSILALVMAFMALPMMGQDFLNIYFKDGTFRIFHFNTIVELYTSAYDSDGVQHTDNQFQHVKTNYDEFVYNINDIDSISFTKYKEDVVLENISKTMEDVLPIIANCENIADVEKQIEDINQSKYIEKAWSDGHELHIKIKDWKTMTFHFNHSLYDDSMMAESQQNFLSIVSKIKKNVDLNIKKPSVVIANQRDKNLQDKDFSLLQSKIVDALNTEGFDAKYVPMPSLDFFYKDMYENDVVLLTTHGGYSSKIHDFMTGKQLGLVRKIGESSPSETIQELWNDNYLKIFDDPKYANAQDHIDWTWHEEERIINGEQIKCWVAYAVVLESFFVHTASAQFANPNSIMFNTACLSLKGGNQVADIFREDRNLGTYLGYNESNYYGPYSGATFVLYLVNGVSAEQTKEALNGVGLTPKETGDGNLITGGSYSKENIDVYDNNGEYVRSFTTELNMLPEDNLNRFATNVYTIKKDISEANQEFLTSQTVKLEGIAGIHSEKGITLELGFELIFYDPITNTRHIKAEVVPNTDNNVEFCANLENLQPDRTYHYRAYTYDGLNYNYGDSYTFKIDKIIELQLSTNSLSLEAGWTRTVDITSGSGSYLVESSDEHIATAFVDGNTISVNALTPGDAKITVYDKITGLEAAIMVTVTGQTDTRELMITKTVNKTVYSIYKRILDENDYRTNPDGWNCYLSELVLDIIKDGNTESYVIDDNIYLDKQGNHHSGQQPCMLLDFNKNMIGVFCNSKGYGYNYQMDGYYYYTSMDGISFTKETVFDGANWGWFPYFRDYGDDNVYLCNFSYGGYFTILAVRENGSWDLYYDNQDISAEAAQQIWERIGSVLVIGDTPDDEVDDRIHTVIPEEIRDVIDEYIPIYDGMNPPNIEGSYYLDPQILIGSSLSYDQVGTEYAPEYQKYGNQDMVNNTIDMVRVQGRDYTIEWDKGSGAFISGTGNNFTIYFDMEGESYGIMTKMVYIVSGTKTDTGIKNLTAGFILKEKGDDPEGTLVPVGTFRFFTDQDGMCEATTWPYGDIYGSKKHVKNGLDLPGILEKGNAHLTPVK